jgi:hypothetical protein
VTTMTARSSSAFRFSQRRENSTWDVGSRWGYIVASCLTITATKECAKDTKKQSVWWQWSWKLYRYICMFIYIFLVLNDILCMRTMFFMKTVQHPEPTTPEIKCHCGKLC